MNTGRLSLKHIKQRDATLLKRDQQLSGLFRVAETPGPLVVQLMFVEDDAT